MENRMQFVFQFSFSGRNWKTNYLNRSKVTLWWFSQVWSTRYSKASSRHIPWDFLLYNSHMDNKDPLFRKQLIYFNVYIISCYFHISFILIVNCDIEHISKSSRHEMFSIVAPEVIHKLFKYCKCLFKN